MPVQLIFANHGTDSSKKIKIVKKKTIFLSDFFDFLPLQQLNGKYKCIEHRLYYNGYNTSGLGSNMLVGNPTQEWFKEGHFQVMQ